MTTSLHHRRRQLTPHEIRNTRIRQIGFRKGYDPAEVVTLLQRVAEEVAARDSQINVLLAENARLQTELYARRHGQLPTNIPADLDEALIHRQIQAQHYVDELVATAQNNASSLVTQSKLQAGDIVRTAWANAEQAVREYEAGAGGHFTPDREELTRLATLAQWAIRRISSLRSQVDATDDAARQELSWILDRLGPLLQAPHWSHQARNSNQSP